MKITEGGVCSYGGGCGLRNPVRPVPAPVPVPMPMPYPCRDRDNDLEDILPFLILLIAKNGGC